MSASAGGMSVTFTGEPDQVVAHVSGQMSLDSAASLASTMLAGSGEPRLVIDLVQVTAIEAFGLRALLLCGRALAERGCSMVVRGLPDCERLIDLVERSSADRQNAPETLRRIAHAVLEHQDEVLLDDATIVVAQWNTALEHDMIPVHSG